MNFEFYRGFDTFDLAIYKYSSIYSLFYFCFFFLFIHQWETTLKVSTWYQATFLIGISLLIWLVSSMCLTYLVNITWAVFSLLIPWHYSFGAFWTVHCLVCPGSSWTLICYSLFWSKKMVICLTIYYHDQCFLLEKDRSKYPLCFATTSISCFCSKDWRKDCCFCFYSRSIIVDAFVFSFDHCGWSFSGRMIDFFPLTGFCFCFCWLVVFSFFLLISCSSISGWQVTD